MFGDRLGGGGDGTRRHGSKGDGGGRPRKLLTQPLEALQTSGAGEDKGSIGYGPTRQSQSTLRRHMQQQQKSEGSGGNHRYDMHQVNYWTINDNKEQPWTVAQLRRHMEADRPDDPGVFERTWEHARASVGMVLASAARTMRRAARGLSALDGCGR